MANRTPSVPPRCVLIVGHPGHELRILGWVRRMQPVVAALTDGSGHTERSRLEISKQLLGSVSATPSRLYGISSDREIYSRVLAQDTGFFLGLADSLAHLLIEHRTDIVAGDAIEGYNPSHDLCRLVIDRAVRLASHDLDRPIENYAFPLVGHPAWEGMPGNRVVVNLSADELQDKLSESLQYAEKAGGILGSEIAESLTKYGTDAFATEVLTSVDSRAALAALEIKPPFYESYGEQQVRAGFYRQAIKYQEHVMPLARALLQ